jgi:D-sedoheptulose 7-phosphate isomerase
MGLQDELKAHEAALRATTAICAADVERLVDALCACFTSGSKLRVFGNGGSAADAGHLAAEFMNRLRVDRDPLPAVALTSDTSLLTCVANDSSFDEVFARQVTALGRPGDVVVALSTSGRSANVLHALESARQQGLTTAGLTGERGVESMAALCDILLVVPSTDCARIQECHEFIYHYVAGEVEARVFPAGSGACGG